MVFRKKLFIKIYSFFIYVFSFIFVCSKKHRGSQTFNKKCVENIYAHNLDKTNKKICKMLNKDNVIAILMIIGIYLGDYFIKRIRKHAGISSCIL